MDDRNVEAASKGAQRTCWGRRWCIILPFFLVAGVVLLVLVVATHPPPGTLSSPAPSARQAATLFAPGRAAAEVRTAVAMFRYLISPENTLPVTNQVPVNG